MVRLSVKDTTKQEWIADVKYCLDHPYRMRAFNELTDSERPVIHRLVDEDEHQAFCDLLKEFDDSIPDWVIQEAAAVMGSVQLHTEINADMLKILEITKTSHKALLIKVDGLSRFPQPEPFKKQATHTWALVHGTTVEGAQGILSEGKIRPANWTRNADLARCELPTFGAYYLGRECFNFPRLGRSGTPVSGELERERTAKDAYWSDVPRSNGTHKVYQAGGNEESQVQVSKVGIVTTSEKYTIAHSNHVGVHFAAFRWHHHSPVEYEESSDEHGDYYRRSEYYRRHQDREPDASEPDWSANNQ